MDAHLPVPIKHTDTQHILWNICIKMDRWAHKNQLELSRDPIIYLLWLQNRLLSSRERLWRFVIIFSEFFFSFFIERFSCLLFLWLVSRCHFLFILNCLLLLLNNVFFFTFVRSFRTIVLCLIKRRTQPPYIVQGGSFCLFVS